VIALSCGDGRHIKYEYLPPAAGTACNNNHVPLQKVPESKTQHTMNALVWYGMGLDGRGRDSEWDADMTGQLHVSVWTRIRAGLLSVWTGS